MDDIRIQLIEQIKKAFWKVRLNGGATLHQGRAADDYKSDREIELAARHDREKHWISVDHKKLLRLADAMYFLDDRGILFYSPAYMTMGLRLFDECEELGTEVAITGWARLAVYETKLKITIEQKQAALAYIDYVIEHRGSPGYCTDNQLAKARAFLQS